MPMNATANWSTLINFVPYHIQPVGDEVYVSGIGRAAVYQGDTGELLRDRSMLAKPVFPELFPDIFTDDLWIIQSMHHGVTALYRHDPCLRIAWEYRTGEGVCGVAVDGNEAYICCWHSCPGRSIGSMNQVSIIDGKENWSVPVAEFSTAPIVYGDTVCAGLATGMVWAGDKDNGKEQWRQDKLLRVSEQGNITHENGVLYLNNDAQGPGTDAGSVYALDAATGKILWPGPVEDNKPFANALLHADRVYTATGQGNFVYGFDAASGDRKVKESIRGQALSTPKWGGRLMVHNDFLIIQMEKGLYAMKIADPGNIETLYDSKSAELRDYHIDNDMLYVALEGPGEKNSISALSL
jgi:outer membrane protein assembly factor BamB